MCIRVSESGAGPASGAAASGAAAGATAGGTDLLLVSGDTVFPGSCGRLDLPGSDPRVMYDSLRKLAALPDALPIYPGHSYGGASSTVGAEKAGGLLRDMTRSEWNRMMVRG